jgi:hypothetical protein
VGFNAGALMACVSLHQRTLPSSYGGEREQPERQQHSKHLLGRLPPSSQTVPSYATLGVGIGDWVGVQEVAGVFVERAASTPVGNKWHVLAPAKMDSKRDQNSMLLLSKSKFDTASVLEVTADVCAGAPQTLIHSPGLATMPVAILTRLEDPLV